MSEEKKTAVTEEVKEEVRELSSEELGRVTGGLEPSARKTQVRITTNYPISGDDK